MCCDRPPATTSPLPPMLQLQLPSTNATSTATSANYTVTFIADTTDECNHFYLCNFSVEIQPPVLLGQLLPVLLPVLLHHHYISLRPQCTPATSLALQGGAMYIVLYIEQGSTPVLQGGTMYIVQGGTPVLQGGHQSAQCT